MMKTKETESEKPEVKEEVKEIPKGSFFLAEVPTQTGIIIAKDDKEINLQELVVKMANALVKAGILTE